MTSRNINKRHYALSILLATCLSSSATASNNAIYFSTLEHSTSDTLNAPVDVNQPTVTTAPSVLDTPLGTQQDTPKAPSFVQSNRQYTVLGKKYTVLAKAKSFKQTGLASWYGNQFHGRKTASGEKYNMHALTAAHKTLPIPCYARVTNEENGKSVIVRVNDRGPFHSNRILDVSKGAAAELGMLQKGMAKIKLEVVSSADADETPTIVINEPAPIPQTPQFFVQVGSFSSEGNALNLQAQLSSLIALPIEVTNPNNTVATHKVQIGLFVDEETAKKASEYVLQVAALNTLIIRK